MPGWHVISYDCAKISHQNSTDPLDYPFEADSKSDIHCADNINEKKVFRRCLIYWNFVRRLFFSINDILWFISRSFLFLNLRHSLRIFNLVLSDYLSVLLSPQRQYHIIHKSPQIQCQYYIMIDSDISKWIFSSIKWLYYSFMYILFTTIMISIHEIRANLLELHFLI